MSMMAEGGAKGDAKRAEGRRKRFVLIFDDLESVHLFKDVGQIPFQMFRHFGYDAEIVCRRSGERFLYVDDVLRGLKITPVGDPYRYLASQARQIDVLMLLHISTRTIYRGLLYKLLNPKGCLCVKTDMSGDRIRYAQWGERNFLTQAKRVFLFRRLIGCVDIVSFETEAAFRGVADVPEGKKLLLPNGFDPDLMEWYGVRPRTFADKENIILLVGRHGDYAKNSELMLDALEAMGDLGGWQVLFVGPMTAGFEKRRDDFLQRNPRLAGQVVFTGQIDDKKALFELYSSAKVLCLTSRWESWGMVCVEAMAFGCVPVMTEVSSARDILGNEVAGIVVDQENPRHLALVLADLCRNQEKLQGLSQGAYARHKERFVWKDSLAALEDKIISCQ